MAEIKGSLFRRTKRLVGSIDEFLDRIAEAGLAFERGVSHYLREGVDEIVEEKLEQITWLEGQGDRLRRDIETVLYTEMLIPDAQGDVLSLLDDLDRLLDAMKATFVTFTIERPQIPEAYRNAFEALGSTSVQAVSSTVSASRAYFKDPNAVRDHILKISFFEREADRTAIRLASQIFDSDLPLDRKMHLRDCMRSIDALADEAEDVGDKLAIYAVKRSL